MSVEQPVPWLSVSERIISECVWHYFRFGVSFRDVEEVMASRGVLVTYETIVAGVTSSARNMPLACFEYSGLEPAMMASGRSLSQD
jgi:hypothetical protein